MPFTGSYCYHLSSSGMSFFKACCREPEIGKKNLTRLLNNYNIRFRNTKQYVKKDNVLTLLCTTVDCLQKGPGKLKNANKSSILENEVLINESKNDWIPLDTSRPKTIVNSVPGYIIGYTLEVEGKILGEKGQRPGKIQYRRHLICTSLVDVSRSHWISLSANSLDVLLPPFSLALHGMDLPSSSCKLEAWRIISSNELWNWMWQFIFRTSEVNDGEIDLRDANTVFPDSIKKMHSTIMSSRRRLAVDKSFLSSVYSRMLSICPSFTPKDQETKVHGIRSKKDRLMKHLKGEDKFISYDGGVRLQKHISCSALVYPLFLTIYKMIQHLL